MSTSKSKYKEKFNLTNKTAVVTGGTGFLGRHFCFGLAEHGAKVAVVDLDGGITSELAREIASRYGTKSVGYECDVGAADSVKKMTKDVVTDFGAIDILMNNAATRPKDLDSFFAPIEEYSIETWREVMSVNIDGIFLVAQSVGRQMVKQKRGGSIIQTSSIYGVMGPDHRIYEGSYHLGRQINTPVVYAASKGAVIALTKYLATYWAEKGVRVNSLSPGGVENGQNQKFIKNYSNRIPMNRMALPEEMVGALIYLASDASSYATGQNIIVDGGLSAW